MSLISLAEKSKSSLHWTPTEMMEDEIREIASGERKATKAIVVFLDDTDGIYDVGWGNSGLSTTEAISLLEVAKARLLVHMGYLEGP